MQIAFDDGGFGPGGGGERPQERVWDDSEILEIFDAAVSSHRVRGQPPKKTKERQEPSENATTNDASPEAKKSRLNDNNNNEKSGKFPQPKMASSVPAGFVPFPPFFAHGDAHGDKQTDQSHSLNDNMPTGQGSLNPELDRALTDMLMAWYQSGYATGKFYTLLEKHEQVQDQNVEWYRQYYNAYNSAYQGEHHTS